MLTTHILFISVFNIHFLIHEKMVKNAKNLSCQTSMSTIPGSIWESKGKRLVELGRRETEWRRAKFMLKAGCSEDKRAS